MIIVSDTSPVNNLIRVDHLFILQQLFRKLVIPKAVYEELCEIPAQQKIISEQNWITIAPVIYSELMSGLEHQLDKGEAESIALAIQLQADYLLIDEMKGRHIAEEMGLKIVGLLGILVKAKQENVIVLVKPILERLIEEAGFRIHISLYNRILEVAGENLEWASLKTAI